MLIASLNTGYTKMRGSFVTPSFLAQSYFPSLNGWRAIAVLMVILGHATHTLATDSTLVDFIELFVYADLGVKIFFLLSGFLITTLLIKEYQKKGTISIKAFFIKRTLRIFPVLYLYLIVLFTINKIYDLGVTPGALISAALYINNFSLFESTWFTGHTWSLAIEEQFYLIWPFTFLFLKNNLWIFLLMLIISMPLIRIFWHLKPAYYYITFGEFFNYSETIFTGAFLSMLCFKRFIDPAQKIWSFKWLNILAIAVAFAINFCIRNGYMAGFTVVFGSLLTNIALGILMICSLINHQSLLFKILNLQVMIKIGLLSYSLYIWQQLFIVHTSFYQGKINYSIFPWNLGLSFVAAHVSYHYYEIYFLKLKRKLVK